MRATESKRAIPGLLVLALALGAGPNAAAQCELPPEYTNVATVEEGDFKVVFASDQSVYAPGDTVYFCLIVQNRGTTTVSLNWNIDPQDGILVMPQPCTAVTVECYYDAVFVHPRIVHYFSAGTTLAPGACRVWTHTWDTTSFPAPSGTYNVLGGMYDPRPISGDTLGVFRVPSRGVLLHLTIDGSTPVRSPTWGRIKADYW